MLNQQFYIIINQEEALVDDVFLKEPIQGNKQFWLDLSEDDPLDQQAEIQFNPYK